MIAKLTGVIDFKGIGYLVLDVKGVGYQLFCSQNTLSGLPSLTEKVSLYVETIMREGSLHLYGFKQDIEREWFRLLMTVQGVGARVALAILSSLPPQVLAQAISTQNKAMLSRAEGVGPKLAARLINELKDKVVALSPSSFTQSNAQGLPPSPMREDAIQALITLGYRRNEVIDVMNQIPDDQEESLTIEALVRLGLNKLAKVA